jgi:Ni/Fe-hydrogenase subunit HybB-like protein
MFISWGPASVMFLVAWHVALYLTVQLLEFSPSIFEWLGLKSLRKWVLKMTVGLTIFGVILSTLHQSALGAMFLLAPGKIHPLWYSPYIPWLFFVSAIATGLSMVIVVSALTLRFFRRKLGFHYVANMDKMTLGMGKAASFVLLTYFGFKLTALAASNNWDLLATSWGAWYLVEVIGFVAVPCILFAAGSRDGNVSLVRFAAMATIVGVIINRLNISLIAFNWNLPHREIWNTNEAIVVVAVITIEVLAYRWIVNRMPVLSDHPDYETESPS